MKLIYILGRCFATINVSSILEFCSSNPSQPIDYVWSSAMGLNSGQEA